MNSFFKLQIGLAFLASMAMPVASAWAQVGGQFTVPGAESAQPSLDGAASAQPPADLKVDANNTAVQGNAGAAAVAAQCATIKENHTNDKAVCIKMTDAKERTDCYKKAEDRYSSEMKAKDCHNISGTLMAIGSVVAVGAVIAGGVYVVKKMGKSSSSKSDSNNNYSNTPTGNQGGNSNTKNFGNTNAEGSGTDATFAGSGGPGSGPPPSGVGIDGNPVPSSTATPVNANAPAGPGANSAVAASRNANGGYSATSISGNGARTVASLTGSPTTGHQKVFYIDSHPTASSAAPAVPVAAPAESTAQEVSGSGSSNYVGKANTNSPWLWRKVNGKWQKVPNPAFAKASAPKAKKSPALQVQRKRANRIKDDPLLSRR